MDLLTNLSLFSGVGGLDLAAKWTGKIKTICYVENDPYCQAVLMSRMRSKDLDEAPIWDDVRTFYGKQWRGLVDIVSGGFPCQDLSVAGRRDGIKKGNRSGLWFEFARIVREVGPRFVLVENVPGLVFSGGIGTVLGTLAEAGYDAEWWTLSAAAVGAPHLRERVWIVAHTKSREGRRIQQPKISTNIGTSSKNVADTEGVKGRLHQRQRKERERATNIIGSGKNVANPNTGRWNGRPWQQRSRWRGEFKDSNWWSTEPNVGRVVGRTLFRVDRLRCLGNIVVPQQVLPAWKAILKMAGMF